MCTFPSKEQRDWSKFERFWDKPKVEKFDPKTFQPFDKVLVRNYSNLIWQCNIFSHLKRCTRNKLAHTFFSCVNGLWNTCIPYNDETKYLCGTTDDCPDYYKWWEK